MPQRNAYIEELRRYDDPENPTISPYDVVLPPTTSDAVIVPSDGKSVTEHLSKRVIVVTGKGLSTNDYSNDEKLKLAGIAEGATKTTVENVLNSTSTTNALSAAQGKALNDFVQTGLGSRAPTSHASTETTYGPGNASDFGHVKVSDSYTISKGNAAAGVSASSYAIAAAYANSVTVAGGSRALNEDLNLTRGNSGIRLKSDEVLLYYGDAKTYLSVGPDAVFLKGHLLPAIHESYSLGSQLWRWYSIHLLTSPIVASDRKVKENIKPLSDEVLDFIFEDLDAVTYQNKKTKEHSAGFIAQFVEAAMKKRGIEGQFNLVYKELIVDGKDIEDATDEELTYALRYEQLIPGLVSAVQYLKRELGDLRNELASLKEVIL